jgi:iron complex transport system substrate-binding protein
MSRRFVVLLLLLGAVAWGCGTRTDTRSRSDEASGAGSFPKTIEAANGSIALDEAPERIVSLSATATEMLFAIDAGDQVVAVDDTSNYPREAPMTKLSAFTPNAEAIAEYEPDLVVLASDIGNIVKALGALNVPVLLEPAAKTFDEAYGQISQLGEATGHTEEAGELVTSMKDRIAELRGSVPKTDEPQTYFHELDQKLFSATSKTFIGQVYAIAGLRNIADAAKGAESGYPQLTAEYVVRADPDFVFLADTKCCGQTAAKVGARPGWDKITAVRNGAVVALDDDVASRWGPRIVDLLELVVQSVSRREPPEA